LPFLLLLIVIPECIYRESILFLAALDSRFRGNDEEEENDEENRGNDRENPEDLSPGSPSARR